MDVTVVGRNRLEVRGGTLTVVSGKDAGRALLVGAEKRVIGRNDHCDLMLDDKKVSAVHCEVVATERGVLLRDLGSRNGTFLGDVRIVEIYLTGRATLRCGECELSFVPATPEAVDLPDFDGFGPLVGSSAAMRPIFDKLRKAAARSLAISKK